MSDDVEKIMSHTYADYEKVVKEKDELIERLKGLRRYGELWDSVAPLGDGDYVAWDDIIKIIEDAEK